MVECLPAAVLTHRMPLVPEVKEYVRQGWVLTLARHGNEAVRAALSRLLRTEPSSAVLQAILGTPRANDLPTLVELMRGEDTVLRVEAAQALGQQGDPRARQARLEQHERPLSGSSGSAQTVADAAASALRTRNSAPTRSQLSAVWTARKPRRSKE